MKEYLQNVHKNSYNFLFAGVLLLIYEIGMQILPNPLKIANGIDVLFESLIEMIPGRSLTVSAAVLVVGLVFIAIDLKKGTIIKPFQFVLMFLESFVWALIIFFNLSFVVGKLIGNSFYLPELMQVTRMEGPPTYYIQDLVLSMGAGFYEELFFRLFLINFFFLIAKAFKKDPAQWKVKWTIILVSAFLFSAIHYLGTFGDRLELNSFLQRFFFGLIMYPIFIYRGFGIVAWTHALYDVLVFTNQRM